MGITRYVHLAFGLLGILLGFILASLFEAVARLFVEDLTSYFGILQTTWVAIPIAAGATFLMWRNKRVFEWASEVAQELKKVSWPTREETRASTVVVIVLTIIMAVFLGLFDLLWSYITDLVQSV
jgi:preprotein translocase subunit SecE